MRKSPIRGLSAQEQSCSFWWELKYFPPKKAWRPLIVVRVNSFVRYWATVMWLVSICLLFVLGRSERKIFKRCHCSGSLEVNIVGEILKWLYSMNTSLVLQSQIGSFWSEKYRLFARLPSILFASLMFLSKPTFKWIHKAVSTFWKLTASTSDSVELAGKQKCCKKCVLTLVKGCHQDFVLVILQRGV